MKISEMRAEVEKFSKSASDNARQLAFAGLAVVWIFKVGGETSAQVAATPSVPTSLVAGVFWFVLCLTFDLLHYLVAALAWHMKAEECMSQRDKDSNGNPIEGKDFKPGNVALWGDFFFYAKFVPLIFGYFVILKFILIKWNVL